MTTMNLSQARVINPVLTTIAIGYSNRDLVGAAIAPRVPVLVSGGQILEFDKGAFQANGLRRAPGGRMHEVDLGYAGKPFALLQDGIEGKVPFEQLRDASIVPGIDLGSRVINRVMAIATLSLEIEIANLTTTPANFSSSHVLTPAVKWSDPASSPVGDVDAAKEVIRSAVGIYPNTLTIGPKVFIALKNHPTIKDQFKYTNPDSLTVEMLAKYFNVDKVIVGRAVKADDQGVMSDVWPSAAVLHYTPATPAYEEPSFAYTYAMTGHPLAEQPYFDRSTRSWKYPLVYERAPVLTCADAGFLFTNPIA